MIKEEVNYEEFYNNLPLLMAESNPELEENKRKFRKVTALVHKESTSLMDVGCGIGSFLKVVKAKKPHMPTLKDFLPGQSFLLNRFASQILVHAA